MNVGNGTLTMKKDITKRLLIEYNIDDITKIEPSMGSQGKAWVFNVMSGESDDDEIVYVVFDVSLEYCENLTRARTQVRVKIRRGRRRDVISFQS